MNFRAVIFDLDGVIVCTDRFHYQAWKETVEGLGISFDEEMNNRLRGVGRMESLEILLEYGGNRSFSREEKEKLAAQKNEIYRGLLAAMTPDDVTEEVRDTLAEIRRRGYGICLGSSSRNAEYILERTGLKEAFDRIVDGNQIKKSKPDPEVFLKGAALLGEKPEDCLVVEDAEAGIEAGIAGGMKTAAIGGAVTCGKADYRLERLGDLLGILDSAAGLPGDARKGQDRRQN